MRACTQPPYIKIYMYKCRRIAAISAALCVCCVCANSSAWQAFVSFDTNRSLLTLIGLF